MERAQRHKNYGLILIAYIIQLNYIIMTRGNNILLAALGGAAVGALVASALSTEKGRQMLDSASNTIKDISGKATEYARQNIGEVIRETKDSIGGVVKEKIAEQVKK
jgi:hypothetical protein